MDLFHPKCSSDELHGMSNLSLAYLGDAVFELMVRSHLCTISKLSAGKLHRAALDYVAAPRQAALSERLLPLLSEEEESVLRRGRNAKPHAIPKGASRSEYQSATALEALFGWLYLQGRLARLEELMALLLQEEPEGGVQTCP